MHGTTPSVHGRNQLPLSSRASAAGQSWDLGTAGSREQQRWRCRDREDTGLWRAEARSRAEPTCVRSQRAAPNPSSLGGDAWEDADRRLNQPGGGAGNHRCRRREGLAQRPLLPSPGAQQRAQLSAGENAQSLDPRPGGTCPFRPCRGTEERRRVAISPGQEGAERPGDTEVPRGSPGQGEPGHTARPRRPLPFRPYRQLVGLNNPAASDGLG